MDAAIHVKRWKEINPPEKILVIRFQALGDTIITFPYIKSLKRQFPLLQLDFLTRAEVSSIPKHLQLFENVLEVGGGRNAKLQLVFALLKIPQLLQRNYDAVIDLQNNRISRVITKILSPGSWSAFDAFSPASAGERTQKTIEALWSWNVPPETSAAEGTSRGRELLEKNGLKAGYETVILNPAGYCASRSWPLKNWVDFARGWLEEINPLTRFVLLLMPAHAAKAKYIKQQLGDHCIDLTGKADQVDAYQIIACSSLMLSEDSGLMHMAWTQGIPTIALFSSSRKDWSGPGGNRSVCLDSSDMACGPCNREICTYGDNRCLTRYSPLYVLEHASHLRYSRQDV